MSSRSTSVAQVLARLTKAALALKDPGCPISTITVDKVVYKNDELQKKIEEVLAPFEAVVAARQVLDNALVARSDVRAGATAFMHALYAALAVNLAADNAALADYGGKPRKARATRTVEQKAAAADKARATRKARHTMGKKQKAAIHGTPPNGSPSTSGG